MIYDFIVVRHLHELAFHLYEILKVMFFNVSCM